MKAWFYGLQPRERWIVVIGAAVAVVIIVWGFVVSPLRAETARLRASVDTKQRLLIDVARIEGEQPSLRCGQPARSRPNARRHHRRHGYAATVSIRRERAPMGRAAST